MMKAKTSAEDNKEKTMTKNANEPNRNNEGGLRFSSKSMKSLYSSKKQMKNISNTLSTTKSEKDLTGSTLNSCIVEENMETIMETEEKNKEV